MTFPMGCKKEHLVMTDKTIWNLGSQRELRHMELSARQFSVTEGIADTANFQAII